MNAQRALLKVLSKLPAGALRLMAGTPIQRRNAALDPLMQLIWLSGKKQPPVETMTPVEARAVLEEAAKTLQDAVPRSVSVRDDSIPGPGGEIPIRLYTPKGNDDTLPVTLYFHFGGHVIGSRNICDGFCGLLCERAGSLVVNVEYRLAPEHPFPAAVEDAFAAYDWVLDCAASLGGDASRIAVAGDSAGGQLAAVIAQESKRQGWAPPTCQVLIYPWLVPNSNMPSYEEFADAYPLSGATMAWFRGHYFRSDEEKNHRWAAPLNQAALSGLSEAVIVTAGFDPLRDEGEAYATRLREAGVTVSCRCYEHLTHSFSMLGGVVPAAHRALVEIADDLSRRLHKE